MDQSAANDDEPGGEGSHDNLTLWQRRVVSAICYAEREILKDRLKVDDDFAQDLDRATELVEEIVRFPGIDDDPESDPPPNSVATGYWSGGQAVVVGFPEAARLPEIEAQLRELAALVADDDCVIHLTGGNVPYEHDLICYRGFVSTKFELRAPEDVERLMLEVRIDEMRQGRWEAIAESVRAGVIPPAP
ncbi:hypothetical protein [Nitrospirillum bahiense]|uniref:Uncharacterized protein n=1 Tax=Nitrospirillum amazonense TaxID=28077 RepID=A0A560FHN9_9PROT|nr:hypothetical protein [Nitrospirillum amazonense]TWB21129.1 hypothetical protein FBZ88_119103 [Nitrospirillum amazonense]